MYKSIFLAVNAFALSLTNGFGYLGNLEIETMPAGGGTVVQDLIIVVFQNECNGVSVDDRIDVISNAFACLDYKTSVVGPHLTAAFFDSSETNCVENIDDGSVDLSQLCIDGVSFDSTGSFTSSGSCTTRGTTDTDLASIASWGVDGLDGIYDNQFTYYNSDSTIDIYILDTGIRTTHEEFSGRAITLAAYAGVEYWSDSYSPAYHGTSCASNAGGNSYGASQGQIIYNVNMAGVIDFGTYGFLYPSTCFTLLGLQDSYQNMLNTGRRGVLSMSFSIALTESQINMFNNLASAIDNIGGKLVASAGNSNSPNCFYPALSEYVISVGAYAESLNLASFTNWGDCVDVYGPGFAHHAASSTTDNSYHDVYGTSFSGPTIAGIVANMLAECEDTGYEDPCTLDIIRARFDNPFVQLNDLFGYRCTSTACNGVQYECGAQIFPRPISQCSSSPCDVDEMGNCAVYHPNTGCSQCTSGYFKKNFNYPCVHCQETFGASCIQCQDWNGCAQCVSNDFTRVYDSISGLYYCEPSPCLDDDNNCQVCNNGMCSQCIWPYTLNPDGKSCS